MCTLSNLTTMKQCSLSVNQPNSRELAQRRTNSWWSRSADNSLLMSPFIFANARFGINKSLLFRPNQWYVYLQVHSICLTIRAHWMLLPAVNKFGWVRDKSIERSIKRSFDKLNLLASCASEAQAGLPASGVVEINHDCRLSPSKTIRRSNDQQVRVAIFMYSDAETN